MLKEPNISTLIQRFGEQRWNLLKHNLEGKDTTKRLLLLTHGYAQIGVGTDTPVI